MAAPLSKDESFPLEIFLPDAATVEEAGDMLHETEQLLHTVLESMSDAVVVLDNDWRYTYVNTQAARIFSRRQEDMIGRHIWTEFPEGVGQPFYHAYYKAFADQSPLQIEEYYPPYDRWFENRIYPSPQGLSIFFYDITDRKQTETALLERERQMRIVTDNVPLLIARVDVEGRYRFANQAYQDKLGIPPERVVGRTMAEVLGEKAFQAIRPYVDRALAGEKLTYETLVDYRTIGPRYIQGSYVPEFGPDGAIVGFVLSAIDVTERWQAQEARRKSEEKFRTIIDVSPLPYALNDEEQNITFLNREFIRTFGYTLEDIPTLADWWPRAYPNLEYRQWAMTTWQARLEEAKRTGKAFEALELNVQCKDGTVRTVVADAAALGGGLGDTHLVILYDITDRKRVEEEKEKYLQEAQTRADLDPLTELLNHRVFQKRVEEEAACAECEHTTFAIIMLDLDNFKFFNDAYGHAVGDEVLRQVARRLHSLCRPNDIVARFGGDEFALLLPGVGGEARREIEERLRAGVEGLTYLPDGHATTVPIAMCVGVALYPDGKLNWQEVINRADERLRRAKMSGMGENEADQVRSSMLNAVEGFSMLDALVTAVDNKDRYTRRHSEDVLNYSLTIARELGFSEAQQHTVAVSALLHDVGKIGVPDAILRKPGSLTDAEFEAIKQHPQMGAIMVSAVLGLEETLDAVRHHHERWDGEGYPFGLKGEETPLMARLMAVADAFSAMTTDRPYRKGMAQAKALAILEAGAGTQWDAVCVAAFVSVMRRAQ